MGLEKQGFRSALVLALGMLSGPASGWAQQTAPPQAQPQAQGARQGTADLGMSQAGERLGPGMNAASVGDYSYHTEAVPHRKRVLAWADVSQGYQHDSVSHALAT